MKRKKNIPIFPDTDPRSINYHRILNYPDINLTLLILKIFLPLLIAVILYFLLQFIVSPVFAIIFTGTSIFVYAIFNFKNSILSSVKIYQRFAPQKIRLRCRFGPSCSQYMILAVEKYGVIKGVCKGIKRLSKCNSRGDGTRGGIDYP